MKKRAVLISAITGVCAVAVVCMAMQGTTIAAATDNPNATSATVRTPDDFKSIESFTEKPGDEGFISIERMRSQCYALMQENPDLAISSNPYDFIRDGVNPYYNEIIAMGSDALPSLKKELKESPANGCEEYLFAIAIEEILNANGDSAFNGDSRPWTGKEYLEFLEDESK